MDKAIIFLTPGNTLEFVLTNNRDTDDSAKALADLCHRDCVPLFVTHAPSTGRASYPLLSNKDVLKQVMLDRPDELWRALVLADTAIAFA